VLRSLLAIVALVPLAGAATPPWQRSETRAPCASSVPTRQPFFGDLHVHTRWSADAYIFGTRVGPRDAYDFARGGTIPIPDDSEANTRSATIDRPLDFMAVTDHAELFGEVDACAMPGSPVFEVMLCQLLRQAEATADEEFNTTVNWLFPLGIDNPPTELGFCVTPGVDCDARAMSVWQEMQAAAEEAYDRTAACTFTSFIGYEHTPSPLGRHQHRNVIFRNHVVPPIALSHLDTLGEDGFPRGLWGAIEAQCTGAGTGCDAVVIPHNPNLSGGEQFLDPLDAADALRRQTHEPLVEIHQIKGNSECRFDRVAGAGVGTTDELCAFEQDPQPFQGPFATEVPIGEYPRRNLVRPTLEDGLAFEGTLGVNPFRFGFVGATDTHDANAGDVAEVGWIGAQGRNDGSAATLVGGNLRTNPGGLTVAWAEENSRDALFAAFRRRETYATSGTRPVVRFFAGSLDGVACGAPDFLARAYATGTPMGGEIGAVRDTASPRFAVWAVKDAATGPEAGVDLQRIQIVKGWVDASGATREQVIDVAGDGANGAGVDPATCAPTGSGAAELCAVWEDPAFDPRERAFYYARVLENPVCRWSTRVCKDAGVDPFAADCAAQAAAAPAAFADCCLATSGTDPFLTPTVQERAWTSPIWYRPESIGRLKARLAFSVLRGRFPLVGDPRRRGAIVLRATLGRLPAAFDPSADALTVRVSDDDEIFAVHAPAGTLRGRRKRWRFKDRTDGIRGVSLAVRRKDAVLTVTGRRVDLSRAAREDHPVTVAIEAGLFRTTHTRTWRLEKNHLEPEGGR
jgi:hypothetical protein